MKTTSLKLRNTKIASDYKLGKFVRELCEADEKQGYNWYEERVAGRIYPIILQNRHKEQKLM